MLTLGIVSAPTVTTPRRKSIVGKAICTGCWAKREVSSAVFWRICPTANEVSRAATSGAWRIGR